MANATRMDRAVRMPLWLHGALGTVVLLAALLSEHAPDQYELAMQEDGLVEWATVGLFLAAFIVRARVAIRSRRPFDLLVALFCLFVAGEEIAWGQRLAGYVPPDVFLEHNYQQEATLHNFATIFGKPKYILAAILGGFGILLPAIGRLPGANRLVERTGASPPPIATVPWFAGLAALLVWYPLTYTGEWVELAAGALFLGSAPLGGARVGLAAACTLGAAAGVAMAFVSSARSGADPADQRERCAQSETAALLEDLLSGALTAEIAQVAALEKRIRTAGSQGYLEWEKLSAFSEAPCSLVSARRRSFGLDPWGMAYWVEAEETRDGKLQLGVYSFGPNRRRDTGGDDVRERVITEYSNFAARDSR
jgi:hypothetical protein